VLRKHDPTFDPRSVPIEDDGTSEPAATSHLRPIYEAAESYVVEPSTQTDGFTDFLIHIEDRQDALRDAREALLGSRYRLQVQRRELRNTREKAASQTGATFNRIRKYLLELNLDLPSEIDAALSEADLSRDDLGIQELEYEEAERAYNLEEWRYTEKETKFVDDVSGSAPVASQRSGPFPLVEEDNNILRFSYGPQDIAHIVAEADGELLPFAVFENDLQADSIDYHSEDSEGQSTVSGEPSTPLEFGSIFSHESIIPEYSARTTHEDSQTDDNVVIGHYRMNWSGPSGTLQYIDKWLLDILKTSELEKRRLKASLSLHDIQQDEWWLLVEQHWTARNADNTAYHTGDTTVSDETLSEAESSNAMRRLFDTSSIAESAIQTMPALNMLPQEVGEYLELAPFPKRIKRRDLVDHIPERPLLHDGKKHVKFLGSSLSDHSESTHPPLFTQASSGLDFSSTSGVSNKTPGPSSGEKEMVCHTNESFNNRLVAERPDKEKSDRPFTSLKHNEREKTDHLTQQGPLPSSPALINSNIVGGESSFSYEELTPQAPGLERQSYFSVSESHTSPANDLYIKVKSPEP
jgi:hypothetical protein